ncbi:MAG: hypothetical protein FJ102_12545 [Deltaproteobacteria bacterium]|nr:hypothetical protein [Deltaproteobacteria bacterium]
MLAIIALATAAPLESCSRSFGSDEVLDAASIAEQAFASQDAENFASARSETESRLGCVHDPLSALDVVRLHRLMALGAFLDGDEAKMKHAVAGMLTIDPDVRFPEELAPTGHKLDQIRAALVGEPRLPVGSADGPVLAAFADGWIEVNGAFAPRVATDVSATLQRLDNQGVVKETRYYWPGESLGDWESATGEVAAPVAAKASTAPRGPRTVAKAATEKPTKLKSAGAARPASETQAQIDRENRTARHIALLAGTGLGLAATGALYAFAATAEQNALDPEVPEPQAEVFRSQANGLTWGWIGTTVLAGGLATTLVVTW